MKQSTVYGSGRNIFMGLHITLALGEKLCRKETSREVPRKQKLLRFSLIILLRALLKAEIKTTSGLRAFYSQNSSWLCPENPDEVNKVAQSMERKKINC